MSDQNNSKPLCKVKGMLNGGRAMCGRIIVGRKYCGLPKELGTCEHQITEVKNDSQHKQ